MSRRKPFLIIFVCFLVLLSGLVYWFYYKDPKPFLNDKALSREITSRMDRVQVKTIQDKVFLDERHVFVPYVTKNNKYGMSYWEWKNNKWRLLHGSSTGGPRLLKLDLDKPSTYYFAWNIHPSDKMESINFYLLKERSYRISNSNHLYQPGILLKHSLELSDKTYGVLKLPEEWASYLLTSNSYEKSTHPDSILGRFIPTPTNYFGWMPSGVDGREKSLDHTLNGSSFTSDEIVEHIMFLSEQDLERYQ
jgi:hypothetical protein